MSTGEALAPQRRSQLCPRRGFCDLRPSVRIFSELRSSVRDSSRSGDLCHQLSRRPAARTISVRDPVLADSPCASRRNLAGFAWPTRLVGRSSQLSFVASPPTRQKKARPEYSDVLRKPLVTQLRCNDRCAQGLAASIDCEDSSASACPVACSAPPPSTTAQSSLRGSGNRLSRD